MKVSVIVPNYNHAPFLTKRIDSIVNQSFSEYELIVLDDASTDNSKVIIEEYAKMLPEMKIVYNHVNTGNPFAQWDKGVRMANGEYVWIAESDDYAAPDFLAKAVGILDEYNRVGMVYCDASVVDEKDQQIFVFSENKKKLNAEKWSNNYINDGVNEISQYLCIYNLINNVSGVLFRKDKYMQAGYADHDMKYCGDWFLYIRMLTISDIAYIAEPLNVIRYHGANTRNDYFKNNHYIHELIKIYGYILHYHHIPFKNIRLIFKNLMKVFIKTMLKLNN